MTLSCSSLSPVWARRIHSFHWKTHSCGVLSKSPNILPKEVVCPQFIHRSIHLIHASNAPPSARRTGPGFKIARRARCVGSAGKEKKVSMQITNMQVREMSEKGKRFIWFRFRKCQLWGRNHPDSVPYITLLNPPARW